MGSAVHTTVPSFAFYVAGGSLPPDAQSYIARKADAELYDALVQGDYCYLLDTRQVGKSSLMVRTAARLRHAGISVAVLDLSAAGQNVSVEQWYSGMLYALAVQINLEEQMETFWMEHQALGPVQRWMAAVTEGIPRSIDEPLVVFVDEVDSVRSLPFAADEFFAAVRECYNRRATNPALRRITFCLIGVARPSDLIRNPHTTPFNIGRRIELSDFTPDEAALLARGLGQGAGSDPVGRRLLDRVLFWTGGHPYLTQRLCRDVAGNGGDTLPGDVDRICEALFLSRQAMETDDNLTFARNRIVGVGSDAERAAVLALYAQVRRGASVRFEPTDPRTANLRLAGLLRVERGMLAVRCRIYARVFDMPWVRQNMPGDEERRQRHAMRMGYARASLVWAVLLAMAIVALSQTHRAQVYGDQAARASDQMRRLRQATAVQEELLTTVESKRRSAERALIADRHEMARTRASMKELLAARAVILAQFAGARSQVAAEQARSRRSAAYITSMSGQIASAFAARPETARQALDYGIRSVAPAIHSGKHPSAAAVTGLVRAVNQGIVCTRILRDQHPLRVAVFSPDGQRILAAGRSRLATIWNAQTGAVEQTLRAQDEPTGRDAVTCAEYSSDGRFILTSSTEAGIRIWDRKAGNRHQIRPIWAINLPSMSRRYAAFSPNSSVIATTTTDNRILICDIASRTTRILNMPPNGQPGGNIASIAWSHSGREIATGFGNGIVQVWNAADGSLLATYTHPASPDESRARITALAFDAYDKLVMVGSGDGVARAWRWRLGTVYRTYDGFGDPLTNIRCSGNHFFFTTAAKDRTVRVWMTDGNGHPAYALASHQGIVFDASFDPASTRIVTASDDGTAQIWKMTAPIYYTVGAMVNHVEYSRDGQRLLMASSDGYARDHCTEIGNSFISPQKVLHASYAPDASRVASSEAGGDIRVWTVAGPGGDRRDCVWAARAARGPVYMVNWSPDGKRLITAGADGLARIWDSRTGKPVGDLRGHGSEVVSAEFTHDGRGALTASEDGSAALWDLSTCTIVRKFLPLDRAATSGKRCQDHPWSAYLSPDGRHVLTADSDRNCYLWDTRSGRLVGTLRAHWGAVYSARFSADGKRIVSAGEDGSVRVWNTDSALRSGRAGHPASPLITIENPMCSMIAACFSPDGRWIVAGGTDNMAHAYPASLEQYLARARELRAMIPAAPASHLAGKRVD